MVGLKSAMMMLGKEKHVANLIYVWTSTFSVRKTELLNHR